MQNGRTYFDACKKNEKRNKRLHNEVISSSDSIVDVWSAALESIEEPEAKLSETPSPLISFLKQANHPISQPHQAAKTALQHSPHCSTQTVKIHSTAKNFGMHFPPQSILKVHQPSKKFNCLLGNLGEKNQNAIRRIAITAATMKFRQF